MTHNEAVAFLKKYPCVCPYGMHPNNEDCGDKNCEFYKAVNSLEEIEKTIQSLMDDKGE